jgi:hypothetical protein
MAGRYAISGAGARAVPFKIGCGTPYIFDSMKPIFIRD